MNIVALIGRLTRDPELKFGQSGKAYVKFSLAVDKPFQKGENKEADFINCAAFNKTAELIGEYLRKGSKVAVNGSLAMNRYEVNGEKRTTYEVLVNNVEFLDSKGTGSNSGGEYSAPAPKQDYSSQQPKQNYSAPSNAPTGGNSYNDDFSDDDFPF